MGTFIAALSCALNQNGFLKPLDTVVMLFATLCVDMGTTGFNTFFDYWRGTDNSKYTVEREKVLVHEDVAPFSAFFVSLLLFFIAALLGLVLAYRSGYQLIFFGAACMLVGYFYTAGPYPISRSPFGELFAGLFLGTALFLITLYIEGVAITFGHALATIPFILLIGMILSVNNGCDWEGDKADGRKTLSIVLGKRFAFPLIVLEALLCYAFCYTLVILRYYPWPVAVTLTPTFVLLISNLKRVGKAGLSAENKGPHMQFAANTYLFFCLAFSLGNFISYLL